MSVLCAITCILAIDWGTITVRVTLLFRGGNIVVLTSFLFMVTTAHCTVRLGIIIWLKRSSPLIHVGTLVLTKQLNCPDPGVIGI